MEDIGGIIGIIGGIPSFAGAGEGEAVIVILEGVEPSMDAAAARIGEAPAIPLLGEAPATPLPLG